MIEPVFDGVYPTMQALALLVSGASVHVLELKAPPAPLSLQDTVPVGAVFVPKLVSPTLPLKVMTFPTVPEAGFGATVVAVLRRLDVRDDTPALGACVLSPK